MLQRPIATQNFIINLATGLRATSHAEIPLTINFEWWQRPWYNENRDEQLAAFIVSHPNSASVQQGDSQRTVNLVAKLAPVWEHWEAMEHGSLIQGTESSTQTRFRPTGSQLYDARGNLSRPTAGQATLTSTWMAWRIYGLLPGFLPDLRNVGVPLQVMATLYRSAEDYIRVGNAARHETRVIRAGRWIEYTFFSRSCY